ncbi:hypothetical protein DN069_33365 [Streptacidiphilus pinicola]|uniref:Uncharacterized protein n=1 Tax=Streptacidiphilus pinicola TaxID=2219663 RepID=A0A2X0ID61_9ACTN|nr:hypothetical protein [Streptacidiphilus pinicola]RAG81341.1 hypothetical protein DN069_33365 [Streptacidiphilus pinicola]
MAGTPTDGPVWPNPECPVLVDALTPGVPWREVRVMREDGTVTDPARCHDAHELRRLVHHERPGADLEDPAQSFWVDHPGEWPAADLR